jgi:hypothetical protein
VIIYRASKSQFLHHALRDDIEDVVSRQYCSATGHGVGPSEIQSWKHSLLEMAKVLGDEEIPEDAGVAIEYQLPQSSKRIDFVITGEDADARTKVIIVELKQWSESRRSEKDAIVWARRGGRAGEREGTRVPGVEHEERIQSPGATGRRRYTPRNTLNSRNSRTGSGISSFHTMLIGRSPSADSSITRPHAR